MSGTLVSQHIEQREGVYYVPGTRITLDSIVYAFCEGCSPESIREDFEGLTLPNVYGAIAFYLDHQGDIDDYLSRRKAVPDREGTPPYPGLQARLESTRRKTLLPRQ